MKKGAWSNLTAWWKREWAKQRSLIFLDTRMKHLLFWPIVLFLALTSELSFPGRLRVSFDAILSGLLALVGLMFSARTFITFKLHEVVYGNPKYQDYVEKLRAEGAVCQAIFDPLRAMDKKLGYVTGVCFISFLLFLLTAILPEAKDISLDINPKFQFLGEVFLRKGGIALLLSNPRGLLVAFTKIISDTATVYFAFCLYEVIVAAISLNNNIHGIIDHWERIYEDEKSRPNT